MNKRLLILSALIGVGRCAAPTKVQEQVRADLAGIRCIDLFLDDGVGNVQTFAQDMIKLLCVARYPRAATFARSSGASDLGLVEQSVIEQCELSAESYVEIQRSRAVKFMPATMRFCPVEQGPLSATTRHSVVTAVVRFGRVGSEGHGIWTSKSRVLPRWVFWYHWFPFCC